MIVIAFFCVNNSFAQKKSKNNESENIVNIQPKEKKSDNVNNSENENALNFDDYFSETDETQNQLETNYASTSTIGIFIRMIVVLVIVVVMIYFVLFFIKRKTNIIKDEDEFIRRAAYLDIAPGKSIEVITLIDKAYLIGVTDSQITMLSEITDKELIQAMNLNADKKQNIKKPVNFNDVLEMFMGKNKKTTIYNQNENPLNNILNKK